MYGFAVNKDDLQVQQARLEHLASELDQDYQTEFDPKATGQIRFRIVDKKTGRLVCNSGPGIWTVSVIADKSDEWIKAFIRDRVAAVSELIRKD